MGTKIDFCPSMGQHSEFMHRNRTLEQYFFLSFVLVFFFWMSLGVLKPIILGLFLALVLNPLQTRLLLQKTLKKNPPLWQRTLKNPSFVAFVLVCLFIALVVLPITYIGVVVAGDARTLIDYLMNLSKPKEGDVTGSQIHTWIQIAHNHINAFIPISIADFEDNLQKVATEVGTFFGTWLADVAKSVPKTLMELVIFALALFFGLSDGKKFSEMLKTLLPFDKREIDLISKTTDSICRGVVVGSLASGISQAIIIGLAYWILGVPRPLFFGVMTALCSFIPFVGSLPAGVGGTIYLFANGHTASGVIMLIAFGIASVTDNVVKPLALKGQLEIHPLIAFVSVIGGLSLFGFAGLFLGPLIAALALVVFEILARETFLEPNQ